MYRIEKKLPWYKLVLKRLLCNHDWDLVLSDTHYPPRYPDCGGYNIDYTWKCNKCGRTKYTSTYVDERAMEEMGY